LCCTDGLRLLKETSDVSFVPNRSSVLQKVFETGLISGSGNEAEGNVDTTDVSILLPVKKKKFLIPFSFSRWNKKRLNCMQIYANKKRKRNSLE
jgi:hypothetical protein